MIKFKISLVMGMESYVSGLRCERNHLFYSATLKIAMWHPTANREHTSHFSILIFHFEWHRHKLRAICIVAIDVVAIIDHISFCINSSGNNLRMGKKSRIRRIKIRKYVFRAFTEKIHYTLNNVMSASVDHMRYESTCRYTSFWIHRRRVQRPHQP